MGNSLLQLSAPPAVIPVHCDEEETPLAQRNVLYYGDNLDVLREHVADESVDLIYLDPPFKSDRDYNVLFQEQDGTRAAAQIKAFGDTWRWDMSAARAFQETVERGGKVSQCLQAFRTFLGENDMLAYLAMMAPRLVELHRVLKSTGSIYLHCDPTASHYLKLLMDAVFGAEHFCNEIIWKRTHAHGSARRFAPVHDSILFWRKSHGFRWYDPRAAHDANYLAKHFKEVDEDGRRFQAITLTGSGTRRGESGRPWRSIDPTKSGRHWAIPGEVIDRLGLPGGTVQDRLEALDAAGRIHWPKKRGGKPRLKWYLDELEGTAIPDIWTDVPPISAQSAERLGYPTQKPERLIARILEASSKERDVVLDPFCGCGTTIIAAHRLKRRWIGIDITHLAVGLIKHRLRDAFGTRVNKSYAVVGEPVDVHGARALAAADPYQFQWWALGLAGARPVERKRGADKGVDGRLFFHDGGENAPTRQVVFSVKSGQVTVAQVRDLRGVMEREKAAIGVLLSLEEPTRAMRAEAASAGYYEAPGGRRPHARIQLVTISELLEGMEIDMPPWREMRTFKRAPRARVADESPTLPFSSGSASD